MGKSNRLGLAVVERIWDDKTDYSVKPLFDLLAEDERSFRPTLFKQTTFSRGFLAAIRRFAADADVRRLHIVAHGCKGKRRGHGKIWGVTHKATVEAIKPGRGRIEGIYIAACSVGRVLPVRIMKETDVKWVAYYNGPALWIPSACFETEFWYNFNHLGSIARVAREINQRYRELSDTLGFRILLRRGGTLVPLVEPR
ncbi:MAG TPA: hypothetical protein VGB91_04800, partial [Rhizomicrobium sp.]